MRDRFTVVNHRMRGLGADQVGIRLCIRRNRPEELAVRDVDAINGIERLQDLLVRAQAKRTEEDGAQEFALAIDAYVKSVLLVILKLDPRIPIGNDLAEKVGAIVRRLKKDARRAMQL